MRRMQRLAIPAPPQEPEPVEPEAPAQPTPQSTIGEAALGLEFVAALLPAMNAAGNDRLRWGVLTDLAGVELSRTKAIAAAQEILTRRKRDRPRIRRLPGARQWRRVRGGDRSPAARRASGVVGARL